MPTKRRIHPSLREEDVPRPLDLAQQSEAAGDVLLRRAGSQWMVQVAQTLEYPGLAPPELNLLEAFEEAVSHTLVG